MELGRQAARFDLGEPTVPGVRQDFHALDESPFAWRWLLQLSEKFEENKSMLEFCYTCGFMGLEAAGSEFEALNNAIVRAAMRGPAWKKLNEDWQDEAVEERTWKQALPPLWSSVMEAYWTRYAELYRAEKNRTGLVNPYDVAPTGIAGALKDLYKPTVELTEQAQKAASDAITRAKEAALAKLEKLAKEAGAAAARGAREEGTNWTVWLGSLAVLGAVGYFALRPKLGLGDLDSAYRSRRRKLRYLRKQRKA